MIPDIPERTIQNVTKINISDRSFAAYSEPSEPAAEHHNPPQPQSRTAPGRLEAHDTDSEEEHFNLKKVTFFICLDISIMFAEAQPRLVIVLLVCCYEES